MLTWVLWRRLKTPPTRSPVYARSYQFDEEPIPFYIGCWQGIIILLIFPVLALAGLVYGAGWTVGIANRIAREHANGTFELLALAPSGPLGVSWALATGYLYQHRTFVNINQSLWVRVVLLGAMISAGVACYLPIIWGMQTFDGLAYSSVVIMLVFPVIMATTVAALYIDHLQSLVLAAYGGMLAPLLSRDRANAQIIAFALYAGAQLAVYLSTLLIGFIALPLVLNLLGLPLWITDSVALLVRLAVFAAARELIIQMVWHALNARLSVSAAETESFVRRKR